MRPIAIFVLIAALSLGAPALFAKTVNGGQGNANDRSVAAVAGPTKAANSAKADENSTKQPSKAELKKSKVKAPPPLHDPN
jgi:hypothetical protein